MSAPVILALSIPEAAKATGYGINTIRDAIALGDLTAKYANSKPIILVSELETWLRNLPSEAPKR